MTTPDPARKPTENPPERSRSIMMRHRLWLPAIVVFLVIYAFGLWGFYEMGFSGFEAVYRTLQLFTLEFNPPEGATVSTPLQLARFLAPLVLVFAIIKLLFDRLDFQFQRLCRIALKPMKSRDIVVGFGPVGREIGRRLNEQGRCVTWIDRVEGTEETLRAARDEAERMGGILINGKASERRWLALARAQRAVRAFIALDNDLAALDAAEAIRDHCAQSQQSRWWWCSKLPAPDIRLFTESLDVAGRLPVAARSGFVSGRGVRMFNLRAEAARRLVLSARWDRLALMLGQRRVHLVVAGCGWHGEALIEEALLLCNRAPLKAPLITVIDHAPQSIRAHLARRSPALLDERLAVAGWLPPRFIEADLETADLAALDLREHEGQPAVPVTAWAFCAGDDDLNLRAALHLHGAMQTRRLDGAPIHARVWAGHQGEAHTLGRDGINQTTIFGSLNDGLDQTRALHDDPDKVSKDLHLAYMEGERLSPGLHTGAATEPADEAKAAREWKKLDPSKQVSNQRLHLHAPMKIADLGFDWRSDEKARLPGFDGSDRGRVHEAHRRLKDANYIEGARDGSVAIDATARLLLSLMKNEHDRWTLDRALDGWRFDQQRDEARRLHPCMTGWQNLDAVTRGYDAVLLRGLVDRPPGDRPRALAHHAVWVQLQHGQPVTASAPLDAWKTATQLGIILPPGDTLRPEKIAIDPAQPPYGQLLSEMKSLAMGGRLCRLVLVFVAPPTPPHLALANALGEIMRQHSIEVQPVWAWQAGGDHAPREVARGVSFDHALFAWGPLPRPDGKPAIIGFAGHRKIADAESVREALKAAFGRLMGGADKDKAEKDKPMPGNRPHLLCGFAEGADQIAVETWKALGGEVRYLFPYADPQASADEKPAAAWTDNPETAGPACRIELKGRKIDPDHITIIKPDDRQPGKSPHVILAEHLLRHADTLVAVWDGQPRPHDGSGDGGTAHVVEMARAADTTHLIIPPDGKPHG